MIQLIIFIAFIATVLGYYFIQKDRLRRQRQRDKMAAKQEKLLEILRKKTNA
jgi:hypothetical protein